MFSITCLRCGSINKPNKKAKGKFIKTFNTLDEFAAFFVQSRSKIYYPNIYKELSKKQIKIFINKTDCIINKNTK